ncbi:hypothetical protein IT570_03465 [Candidatus Sumerlaeota bacterium]|nr:hypothetical protein [Candidatus Sumerlaeota bacterium]
MNLEQLLQRQTALLGNLELDQLRRLKPVFEEARDGLRDKLTKLHERNRGEAFSAVAMKRSLAQVEAALRDIQSKLGNIVTTGAVEADKLSLNHLLEQDVIASQQFGAAQSIDAEGIERLTRDNSLLLDRTSSLTQEWTTRAINQVRGILSVEMAQQTPISEVIAKLSAKDGPLEGRRSDAQRLVRTEIAHHYNERTFERMQAAEKTAKIKPRKRLVNVIDARTGLDSLAIIAEPGNLVKDVDEPFYDPKRGRWFQHPPNRPNDRARIVMFYDSEWEQKAVAAEQKKAEGFRDAAEKKAALQGEKKKRLPEGTGEAKSASKPVARSAQVLEGIHIAQLNAGVVSRPIAAATVDVLREKKLLTFLRAHPLGEISFVEQIGAAKSRGSVIAGVYRPGTAAIRIIKAVPHGEPWRPLQTSTVSSAARSAIEARQAVLLHEFAHHLRATAGSREQTLILAEAFSNTGTALTRRALANEEEYFAESLTAWFMRKESLRKIDPLGYDMIQRSLKVMGVQK